MRSCSSFIAAIVAIALLVWSPQALGAEDDDLDRSTPRRAMTVFLVAAEGRDFATAAKVLDLRALPQHKRASQGPELAAQLHHILERNVWIEPHTLSDDPEGNPADGVTIERIGSVKSEGLEVPITLSRLSSSKTWAISAATVARVPRLYAEHEPSVIEAKMPSSLRGRAWGLAAWQWLGVVLAILAAFVIGRAVTFVLTSVGGRLAKRTEAKWDDELVVALRRPGRFLVGVLAYHELLPYLGLSAAAKHVFSRLIGMITIAAIAWAVIGIVGVVSRVVERRVMDAAEDGGGDVGLRARGVRTQVRVLRRVVNVAVGIVASALMLMQFELVRTIGVSLLASAGVAGVVLGFAAQRTIGSLIAGIQLSFTQPIRIGDVVIVEKEWGTIEEVTLTYVVVRIWDERRLIVPMTRFLEQPFENWTKVSPQLHGTVFLYVDYKLPIDAMRDELDRILADNAHWDGRTKGVVVTNTSDRTIEVRAMVSAANSSNLWNLRVTVRERLVAWLREYEGGRYLPRVRVGDEDKSEAAARAEEVAGRRC